MISAIPNLVETWTVGFGFEPLDDAEKETLKNINLMVFPGTILLKKMLHGKQPTDRQAGKHVYQISISSSRYILTSFHWEFNTNNFLGITLSVDALPESAQSKASFKEVLLGRSDLQSEENSSVKEADTETEAKLIDCENALLGEGQQVPPGGSGLQSEENYSVKKAGAETEAKLTDSENVQLGGGQESTLQQHIDEDQQSSLKKHFSNLSCEELVSTLEGSQLEMVSHVESAPDDVCNKTQLPLTKQSANVLHVK